jgi:beta-lysine 5,6-aminomutase alpha subunit
MSNLNLDLGLIARGREAAGKIAEDTQKFIDAHSTVAVERTIARLYEIDGVDDSDVPLPNLVIENIKNGGGIRKGAAYYIANAVLNTGMTPQEIAERVAAGEMDLCKIPEKSIDEIQDEIIGHLTSIMKYIDSKAARNAEMFSQAAVEINEISADCNKVYKADKTRTENSSNADQTDPQKTDKQS